MFVLSICSHLDVHPLWASCIYFCRVCRFTSQPYSRKRRYAIGKHLNMLKSTLQYPEKLELGKNLGLCRPIKLFRFCPIPRPRSCARISNLSANFVGLCIAFLPALSRSHRYGRNELLLRITVIFCTSFSFLAITIPFQIYSYFKTQLPLFHLLVIKVRVTLYPRSTTMTYPLPRCVTVPPPQWIRTSLATQCPSQATVTPRMVVYQSDPPNPPIPRKIMPLKNSTKPVN